MSHEQKTSQLNHDLEIVSLSFSHQLQSIEQRDFIRASVPTALILLMVGPLLAILVQLFRWATGVSAGWFFSWTFWGVVTLAIPLTWLFTRALTHQIAVGRDRALRAADQRIGSSERMVTADHFLQQSTRDGFMQAAVEDAEVWIDRARDVALDQPSTQSLGSWRALWPIPVAIASLFIAGFVSQFAQQRLIDESVAASPGSFTDPITVVPDRARPTQKPTLEESPETTEQAEPPLDQPSQRAVNRQGSAGTAIPDDAEESRGKLSEGETRESQQAANPSSARGAPSTSGQPSKSGEETERKAKPKQKKKPEEEREKKPREQDEKPSGATAGQGSSKGSDNNAAPSDWASSSQAATPDDEDVEDEENVSDDEEEQESRGGVQPNLRDRRTPVNRDLQIGFGSNRPDPDANGRGGPGGQKKSRGVASLVLGVPIPDRVNGQPNKGRIRITQQRITPEAEQSDPVAAQDRLARQGSVGPIHHPDFSPWLQDLVRRYFLERRAQFPLKNPSVSPEDPLTTSPETSSTSTTTSDPLQTSAVSESVTPSS